MDNPLDTRTLSPKRPEASRGKATPPAAKRTGGLLESLKIWQKLFLISAVFALPLLIIMGLLLSRQNRDLADAYKERSGAAYITALEGVLVNTPQHRGLTNALLNGNESVGGRRSEVAAEVLSDLNTVAQLDAQFGQTLQTTADFEALQEELAQLLETSGTLEPAESFGEHTRIINERIIPLVAKVANTSTLILTPDLDAYYLASMIRRQLPNLTETLGQMRGYGAGVLARGNITAEDRLFISNLVSIIEVQTAEVTQSVATIENVNSELGSTLRILSNDAAAAAENVTRLATEQIVNVNTPTFESIRYFDETTLSVDAYVALNQQALASLVETVDVRVSTLQRTRLAQLGLVAAAVLFAFLLAARVSRQIAVPINRLYDASKSLSQGDLNVQANVTSNDELGALARTFNESVVQLRLKAEADVEAQTRNEQLQRNIGEFLNTAMDISDGDFTKRGVVTDDVLGSVVDAINLMVEEVALLLTDVQDAALSVNEEAGEMLTSTGAISQTAQRTAGEAQRIRGEVQGVVVSIQDMARQADTASSAAARALKASLEGQAAVNDTLAGMAGIRDETRSTALRVQSLAARSAEISEIVETISHIASQTNLLALGAALEAAGAGESGDRFAVVADEVRKLADESAEAAGRIDGLISTIQSEVKEVGAQVERNSLEVEVGYRLAGEAGERLREISTSVEQSAGLAQSISQATGVQTGSVKEVGFAVQAMADLAERSRERVSQGQEAAERLRQVAERLSEALIRFRLA